MAPGFTASTAKSYLAGTSMRKVDIDANVGSALCIVPRTGTIFTGVIFTGTASFFESRTFVQNLS